MAEVTTGPAALRSALENVPARKSTRSWRIRRFACSTTILGSVLESPSTISIGRPSTPPFSLISSTAIWKPALCALPYTVQAPVSGEMTPTLIGSCADARLMIAGAASALVASAVVAPAAQRGPPRDPGP